MFLVQLVRLAGSMSCCWRPSWMQLVHLLAADTLWILLVLLAATVLGQPAPVAESNRAASGELLRAR